MNPIRQVIHESAELRVAVVTWPPGYTNTKHEHAAIEVVTVMEGSATLTEHPVGGSIRTHRLRRGAVHVIPRGELHQVEAGDGGLTLLAVVAPNDKFEST